MLKKNYLFTPGPTMVPPEVLAAESQPMMHHRTPQFSAILQEVTDGLKTLFGTAHDVYLIASSGTGAMETAVCNIVSPGDKAICLQAGKFGERWGEIAEVYGAEVVRIEKPYGGSFGPEDVEPVLEANPDAKVVYATQSETSTGALSDIAGIGKLTRESRTLLAIDTITGLGIQEVRMDDWGVDIAVSGSQKGCMMSPGLSFIALAPRVWSYVESCMSPRYYLDLLAMKKSWGKTTTPYTPAISLIRSLHKSISMMQEEGFENVFRRHARLAGATRLAMQAIGLKILAEKPANVVTGVVAPEGVDSTELVSLLRDKYGITIAGGQAGLKGKVFRIGHMGYVNEFDILLAIGAVERGLKELGYEFEVGAGVAAAQKYLIES